MSEFSVLEFIVVTSFKLSPLAVGNPAPKPKKKAKMKKMRTRCTLYILFGILLIVFNVIGYVSYFVTPNKHSIDKEMSGDIYADIGFIIGFNFYGIVGIILLIMAFVVSRKIKRKKRKEVQNLISEIGQESGLA